MAINKNFVIKNGVQVDTDLIVGDSNTKKVGIGTTIPGYTLHVGATNSAGRGGIGATDLNVTGVGTVQNLNVLGLSTFANSASVTGIVSAYSFGIGSTEIIDRGMRLSGIASLDATTTATIEEAIRVGPNSFSDLKVSGISTFVGIATFLGGIDVNIRSGVSTFSAPVQFGFAQYDAAAGLSSNFVAVGATVGFGTSAFFRDNAGLYFGDDSDLKIWHDSSNSYIEDVGTGDLIIRGSADIKLQSASGENYLIGNDTGSVEQYFDNSKKTETTSGGFKVTGITTLTNRLHVQAGVSTFDADVRFGIGATVGFGTSAFFLDDAAIFLGDDSDLKLHHDGSNSYIEDVGTGDLILRGSADIKLQSASGENYLIGNDTGSVEQYFDNSKKTETTSGGFKVTGITTLTDRLHVQSGISTFDADVRYGIGATVGFGTSAFFRDDAAIFLGNDSDLKIHHDGSNSYIEDVGTGDLILKGSADIKLQSASGENYLIGNDTGSVEVYYDNSKKLESTSGGLSVTGITTFSDRINVVSGISTFQDSVKLTFGAQSDLSIWHDATNSYISNSTGELRIDSKTGERALVGIADSGVHIFYDNTKRLETISTGASVTGDLYISGDLYVSDDITYDEIAGRNLKITGVGTFYDDAPLYFGSSQDLKIWHDEDHSYIQDTTGTGNLYIDSNSLNIRNAAGNETQATFAENGAVSLYYDNGNVFQTTPQGVSVTGVTTSLRLNVTGISTFGGNLDINASIDVSGATVLNGDVDLGNATSDTITATGRFDSDLVPSTDAARDLGASGLEWKDLYIDGTANIDSLAADTAAIGDLTDNRVVIAGSSGELEDDANFTYDGSKLVIGAGTGITVFNNGNATFSGITTAAAATVTGDLSVGGNLNVTGDIVYDEITGRNLNITGITTLQGQANFGGTLGIGATIAANGNASFSGIVTASEFYHQGTHLTAGVGIGTTGDGSAGFHTVGFGFTYLDLKGPGISTVYANTTTGIATIYFQGGGTAGAAGTWAPYGDAGIATSKSVGVGTIGMGVTSLQGGTKGASSGIGNSFRGLYIGNGMMVVDNALNGNHYIGTAYNGLMAGPVTINGVLTVDGNYVVV